MRITSLQIENLRNLGQISLAPGPRFNLLHGDNGAGKTSVLEALVILAKGRSFRGGTFASLIGPEAAYLRIVTDLQTSSGACHRVGIQRDRQQWQGRMDGRDLKQVSDTATHFPLVLMEPNSHELVSGSPDQRRRYLDWAVFHVKPDFLDLWRRYARTLKQRNAALRSGRRSIVESLDPQLITLGNALNDVRVNLVEELVPVVVDVLQAMSPGLGAPSLRYLPGWKGDDLEEALFEGLAKDLEQGLTRQGPHRADLQLRIDDRAVRDRLSRGEQKIFAAALLMAQARLFAARGETPLMLLDDLASEFDAVHLERAVDMGFGLGAQLFVTGTDPDAYAFVPAPDRHMFHVEHGVVSVSETQGSDHRDA